MLLLLAEGGGKGSPLLGGRGLAQQDLSQDSSGAGLAEGPLSSSCSQQWQHEFLVVLFTVSETSVGCVKGVPLIGSSPSPCSFPAQVYLGAGPSPFFLPSPTQSLLAVPSWWRGSAGKRAHFTTECQERDPRDTISCSTPLAGLWHALGLGQLWTETPLLPPPTARIRGYH